MASNLHSSCLVSQVAEITSMCHHIQLRHFYHRMIKFKTQKKKKKSQDKFKTLYTAVIVMNVPQSGAIRRQQNLWVVGARAISLKGHVKLCPVHSFVLFQEANSLLHHMLPSTAIWHPRGPRQWGHLILEGDFQNFNLNKPFLLYITISGISLQCWKAD